MPCRFRRAKKLRLGPITVDRPVFMEMDVGGIVSGSAETVAGIVGFDVFKSAVLEVSPRGEEVYLHDPSTFVAPAAWRWNPLLMVSNVPHVAATFSGAPGGAPQIFMIDSGAGGADVIFHARAVKRLRLDRLLPPPGQERRGTSVRGVGGSDGESSGSTRAWRAKLPWLTLCRELPGGGGEGDDDDGDDDDGSASALRRNGLGVSAAAAAAVAAFEHGEEDGTSTDAFQETRGDDDDDAPPRVLPGDGGAFANLDVLLASDAGFDLSEHSCGLLCANALNARRVVYDLPNRRFALLHDGVDETRGLDAPGMRGLSTGVIALMGGILGGDGGFDVF